jgi:hypothetical protein
MHPKQLKAIENDAEDSVQNTVINAAADDQDTLSKNRPISKAFVVTASGAATVQATGAKALATVGTKANWQFSASAWADDKEVFSVGRPKEQPAAAPVKKE